MSTLTKKLTILFLCAPMFIFNIHAQRNKHTEALDLLAMNEPAPTLDAETAKLPKTPADYFRHFKRLPKTYKGYLIELTRSDLPLRRDYHLFNYFGNVHYEHLEEGGYAYYLKIKFKRKSSINKFMKNVILHNAPEAKVVHK